MRVRLTLQLEPEVATNISHGPIVIVTRVVSRAHFREPKPPAAVHLKIDLREADRSSDLTILSKP